MAAAHTSPDRSRRVLALALPLVLALALPLVLAGLAWIAWSFLARPQRAEPPVEPQPASEVQRSPPRSAPLELPDANVSAERLEGEPEARAPERVAQPTDPSSDSPAAGPPFTYRGIVIDFDFDQPVAQTTLVFEGAKAREIFRTQSDKSGAFRTSALAEEPRWMRVEAPEGFVCDVGKVDLEKRRGDIVVVMHRDPATLAGAIRGELLREGGPWTEETLPKPGTVMLDLVPTSGPQWSRRAEIASTKDAQGGLHLRFEFAGLPKGEYLLTLSSLSAWRWDPTSLRVSPPIDNVSFMRFDLERTSQLAFHVTDRTTGEEIKAFEVRALQLTPSQENGVFLHTGPFETRDVPDDARFQWSLWAEGYRPVFGDESAFVREGERRVAEVALEHGWATKVLVLTRAPAATPAARALVEIDGRSMGYTDESGMLAVSGNDEPKSLVVRLDGWRMANDPLKAYNGKNAAQRGQMTIVMLERAR
ncbi:MAG: hypothetical protein IPJ19_19645 [Planctomycetes bacterium]|nr:hypothetical protein [Planctomycetota bacterium]